MQIIQATTVYGVEQPVVDCRVETGGSYADLKRLVQRAGLLEKQPGYLAGKIAVNLGLFAVGVAILFLTNNLALQLLDAVLMAVVWVQAAFIVHDTGHRQAFRNAKTNDIVGLLHGCLFVGGSYGWWVDVHNEHHAHPNTPEADPHIDLPLLAFSHDEARAKRGFIRFIVKYQAWFFFPMLLFLPISQNSDGIRFLLHTSWKYRRAELVLWLLHIVWYTTLLITAIGLPHAILFVLVHRGLMGLYEGSIFAPNHKGMPLIPKDTEIDFLQQQVLTARNIRPGVLVDWWYGGLNFQIEHHLFPAMPRNKLRAARGIIKQFCQTHGVPYYEVGVARSYVEIVQALHAASAPLRERAS